VTIVLVPIFCCSCFYFLFIRILFLSAIFPCYCSCFEQVTGGSSDSCIVTAIVTVAGGNGLDGL
jgi:hypothetical protein